MSSRKTVFGSRCQTGEMQVLIVPGYISGHSTQVDKCLAQLSRYIDSATWFIEQSISSLDQKNTHRSVPQLVNLLKSAHLVPVSQEQIETSPSSFPDLLWDVKPKHAHVTLSSSRIVNPCKTPSKPAHGNHCTLSNTYYMNLRHNRLKQEKHAHLPPATMDFISDEQVSALPDEAEAHLSTIQTRRSTLAAVPCRA